MLNQIGSMPVFSLNSPFVLTIRIIYNMLTSSLSLSLSHPRYLSLSLFFSLPLSGVLRSPILLVLIVLPFSSTNSLCFSTIPDSLNRFGSVSLLSY